MLLNREAGLLHIAKQGGGVITYSQIGLCLHQQSTCIQDFACPPIGSYIFNSI